MPHRKDAERLAYYRRQASACATAALSTTIAEVKQAYIDLEQGWLCLTPKAEARLDDPADAAPAHTCESTTAESPKRDAAAMASRQTGPEE
jgi:hypothetical protein